MAVPKRIRDAVKRARELAPMQDDVSEYLAFVPQAVDEDKKTAVVDVNSKRSGERLGVIRWYGPWRQYVFYPAQGCLFNGRCLADVYDVLGRMMRKRKEMVRAAKPAASTTAAVAK